MHEKRVSRLVLLVLLFMGAVCGWRGQGIGFAVGALMGLLLRFVRTDEREEAAEGTARARLLRARHILRAWAEDAARSDRFVAPDELGLRLLVVLDPPDPDGDGEDNWRGRVWRQD